MNNCQREFSIRMAQIRKLGLDHPEEYSHLTSIIDAFPCTIKKLCEIMYTAGRLDAKQNGVKFSLQEALEEGNDGCSKNQNT